jgi:hypothetical protein
MAQTEINIFFQTPAGFDAHIKLTPGEGEKSSRLMLETEKYLLHMGCKPKPAPAPWRGGGGGRPKSEPVPGVQCPKCKGPVELKQGTNQGTGKTYSGYACMKGKAACGGWINK